MKMTSKTMTFSILTVLVTSIMATSPVAFAETSVTIVPAAGSGAPGCEETAEGCYLPTTATVDVGGVVIMSNDDTAAHTWTSGTPDDGPDGIFDTSLIMAGSAFEWSPDTVGEYPYFCMVHPWMQGVIMVQEAGASSMMENTMMDNSMTGGMMDNKMSMMTDIDQIMAEITTSDGMAGEPMTVELTMTDLEGNPIEHITYNIKATQGSKIVLDEEGHMHKGTMMNSHVTSALPLDASETMPVILTIESVGFGHDEMYVPVTGEIATKQVVPEFGTIAAMILAVAIISIIAVSAKSRLSMVPRL